jgi:hypothetical protein
MRSIDGEVNNSWRMRRGEFKPRSILVPEAGR